MTGRWPKRSKKRNLQPGKRKGKGEIGVTISRMFYNIWLIKLLVNLIIFWKMQRENDLITVEVISMDLKVVIPLEAANLVLTSSNRGSPL
jgi:hypothetical protein